METPNLVRFLSDRLDFWGPYLQLLADTCSEVLSVVTFSPNGRLLAAGSENGHIHVWNTQTWSRFSPGSHYDRVTALEFSPDSRILASISWSCAKIRLWDTGSWMFSEFTETTTVKVISFSPYGDLLASGSSGGAVMLWQITTGRCDKVLAHSQEVKSIAFSPDGNFLASQSTEKAVKVCNTTIFDCRTLISNVSHDGGLAYSPDGNWLASPSSDKTIKVWDTTKWESRTLSGHTDLVCAVAFSPGGNLLASTSHDATVRLWDTKTWKCRAVVDRGDGGDGRTLTFSPDGNFIAVRCFGGLKLWSTATFECYAATDSNYELGEVAFSQDGSFIVMSSEQGQLILLDTGFILHDMQKAKQSINNKSLSVSAVAISLDTKTAALASDDKTIRLWNMSTGELLKILKTNFENEIYELSFPTDGSCLFTNEGKIETGLKFSCPPGDLFKTTEVYYIHENWVHSATRGRVLWLPPGFRPSRYTNLAHREDSMVIGTQSGGLLLSNLNSI